VRGLQVCFGYCVADRHGGIVLAAHRESVCGETAVGSVQCMINGTVVCMLHDIPSLLFFILFNVDFVDILGTVEFSTVAGDMI
jgi:hypothetical protein